MPEIVGFSHLSLSVSDRDESVRWYRDVLGFQVVVPDMDEERWKRTVCMHPSGLIVGFTQHRDPVPFDYRHIGMDHVALAVGSRSALDEWAARFAELGVRHSPVTEAGFGALLSFRDPDDIQLELFYLSR